MEQARREPARTGQEWMEFLMEGRPEPDHEITADEVNRMTLRRMYEEYTRPHE
ncbi:hypothetical protein [Mycetocola tolaasinivorans]|uniref:hypothetical protein n=1 Tax=Mycetocola tolaasinivorans TaxID=76635 RepID=UPI0015FFD00D|nr:hypothetical protein [Mycetocola tolaasinivorans]